MLPTNAPMLTPATRSIVDARGRQLLEHADVRERARAAAGQHDADRAAAETPGGCARCRRRDSVSRSDVRLDRLERGRPAVERAGSGRDVVGRRGRIRAAPRGRASSSGTEAARPSPQGSGPPAGGRSRSTDRCPRRTRRRGPRCRAPPPRGRAAGRRGCSARRRRRALRPRRRRAGPARGGARARAPGDGRSSSSGHAVVEPRPAPPSSAAGVRVGAARAVLPQLLGERRG